MLAEATPAPIPGILRTPDPSPTGTPTTHPTGSSDGSSKHQATPPAQQQHRFGMGEGYSHAGGGHAHFVVGHPRTRWGVDALVPLLRESPGLAFTCEEVSDPNLVAGLEEASYLAWLHVHVWREAATAAPAAAAAAASTATADDVVDRDDRDEDGELAAEAVDEALLVVG